MDPLQTFDPTGELYEQWELFVIRPTKVIAIFYIVYK